jgi:hypothetical protein|tara:strand:- start:708 stop:1049 length:342 start_codon:yes stop_codon:yes gene_type:complete
MPYVEQENKIYTKIRGVSISNETGGRQQMLKLMSQNRQNVKLIFLKGLQVYALYNNQEWSLGTLKEDYRVLIFNNLAKIIGWEITGGHRLMLGSKRFCTARLGINLEIELLSH